MNGFTGSNKKMEETMSLQQLKQFQKNYKKLDEIIPGGIEKFLKSNRTSYKLEASPYMPLHIEKIGNDTISMTHWGEQNGDLMHDPDITIKIHREHKIIEALTYQNDYRAIYQEVYPEPGKVYPKLKKGLNIFLAQWLTNIKNQGHKLIENE